MQPHYVDTHCFYCEREFLKTHTGNNDRAKSRDHIIPLSKGGRNFPLNIVYACRPCNGLKGSLLPDEFVKQVQLLLDENRGFKGLTPTNLILVLHNALDLVVYVEHIGPELYRGLHNNKVVSRERWEMRGCEDIHLSVNNNTRRNFGVAA